MLDPVTIGLIVGLASLFVERVYSLSVEVIKRVKKSSCCGGVVEMEDDPAPAKSNVTVAT